MLSLYFCFVLFLSITISFFLSFSLLRLPIPAFNSCVVLYWCVVFVLSQYINHRGVTLHWSHNSIQLRLSRQCFDSISWCVASSVLNITAHGYVFINEYKQSYIWTPFLFDLPQESTLPKCSKHQIKLASEHSTRQEHLELINTSKY